MIEPLKSSQTSGYGNREPTVGIRPGGATPLDLEDLQGLRLGFISSRAQLDVAEFSNIANADRWFRRSNTRLEQVLTTGFLRKLHIKMFGEVWTWAGRWRTKTTNIGIDWPQIPGETNKAFSEIAYWHEHETFSPQEIAVRLHHRLVKIHPFTNGNGRVTRAVADAYLAKANQPPLTWGSANLVDDTANRRRYISALVEADQTGNCQSLLEFAQS